MGLFKGQTIKKAVATAEKFENKRKELQEKRRELLHERDHLRSELENDFQRQIMEDANPDKRLQNDYDMTVAELERVSFQLNNIDDVKAKELSKLTAEVEKDRQDFIKDADGELQRIKDELLKLKIKYLQTLANHQNRKQELNMDYRKKFGKVEKIVDLKEVDFRSRSILPNNLQHDPHELNPIINNKDLIRGFSGELDTT
ncbi:hypothetical protein [Bacillus haynesii]|uniref:hypothetical protein n=1 Tax=Bacillus haynesii TaxID=1925021 RepID=UPI00227DF4D5|nr:hypothetical protein [Bacillus haynesii]MCY7861593.1 DUF4407 domain-containing protein [Bacillus haynesii]MCY9153917.1 DUF4407 domain-containing protein [Bacillus haynesii]